MIVYGTRIRELREERGYSLADLAAKAGISISYLSEIERGAKRPSLRTIDRIAEALNISKSQLVQLDANEPGVGLGEKIRLIRESKETSMADFARNAGISVSYLSEIERGNVYPAVQTLRVLAEKLGVPVSNLMVRGGSVGAKLRMAREEQGLTQAELARGAGLSPGMIGQIEHGKVQPSLQTVEKIAGALGTSPCYFIVDESGIEETFRLMSTDVRTLLCDPNVQAVLRMIAVCSEQELKFILDFIKLYKRAGTATD